MMDEEFPRYMHHSIKRKAGIKVFIKGYLQVLSEEINASARISKVN